MNTDPDPYRIRDPFGRLELCAPKTQADNVFMGNGATGVMYPWRGGQPVGCWVDDTTPNRADWTQKLLDLGRGDVLVLLGPTETGRHAPALPPGALTALEWFAGWGMPPAHPNYLLWWNWTPPGEKPAPLIQRARVLTGLARRSPRYLLVN